MKRKYRNAIYALGSIIFALGLTANAQASAAAVEPPAAGSEGEQDEESKVVEPPLAPPYVTIDELAVNGSGCPIESVEQVLSEDRTSFSLLFYEYIAEFGPYATKRDNRKFCQITMKLDIPDGWRFSIASFNYQGFMEIDAGLEATQQTSYYFQGNTATGVFEHQSLGPLYEGFNFSEDVFPDQRFWSSCDSERAINIKTSIRISALEDVQDPFLEGIMGTDIISGQIADQSWRLSWERCPKKDANDDASAESEETNTGG